MSWFSGFFGKAVATVEKTEAQLAKEMVNITGEAHVAAIVKAAELVGQKAVEDAVALLRATKSSEIAALVATVEAGARAALASALRAATPS